MVARLNINLTKVFGPDELIKEVVNSGNHVPVSDYDLILSQVINGKSLGSIFILYHNYWAPAR